MSTSGARVFCTIITRSHLSWALALGSSLRQFDPGLAFCVLLTDVDTPDARAIATLPDVEVLLLKDLLNTDLGRNIATKYADQPDELRWSLKPVLMMHLHQRFEKVICGDCDLHFYSDPSWLWKELDRADILLTPHWRSSKATIDRTNFDLLYVGGLYNAGFVAASKKATEPLRTWAENCLEVCIKDFSKGQYVDQTHLNLLPVYFDNITVLKHRGCNVANWNMVECARTTSPGGEVLINGKWPVVFIHFTKSMIEGIISGQDGLLMPHLEILRDRLLDHGSGKDIIAEVRDRKARKKAAVEKSVSRRVSRVVKRITGGK